MRTIVEIPRTLFQRIYKLIEEEKYVSINEIIIASLETQLMIDQVPIGTILQAEPEKGEKPSGKSKIIKSSEQERHDAETHRSEPVAIPEILRIPINEQETRPMPDLDSVNDRPHWLWGINRIAPIKIATRIVAQLISEKGEPIALDDLHREGGDLAIQVGDYLAEYDDRKGNKLGSKLSSGFPRSGKDSNSAQKSGARFGDFYFGNVRKKSGRIDGALFELRLASIETTNGQSRIWLTNQGLEFAKLDSPILDKQLDGERNSLSKEEARWYESHVKLNVPREYELLIEAMNYVRQGQSSSKLFISAMQAQHSDLSEKVLSSIRVCLLGRLLNVGLIDHGNEKEYVLTEHGISFIEDQD